METIDFGFGGSIMVGYVDRCIDSILTNSRRASITLKEGANIPLRQMVWDRIYQDESTMCIATDSEWIIYLDMVFDGCDDVEPSVIDRDRKLTELIG